MGPGAIQKRLNMMVMMVSWFKKPQNLKTNITLIDINDYMIGGERSKARGITKNVADFPGFGKWG